MAFAWPRRSAYLMIYQQDPVGLGMRPDYLKSLGEFQDLYRTECAKANIDYVPMGADYLCAEENRRLHRRSSGRRHQGKVRATRKPMLKERRVGALVLRKAERQILYIIRQRA